MRQELAACIGKIEARQQQLDNSRVSGDFPTIERVSLGIEQIDRMLDPHQGKGIEFAALHEIRSATSLSFAAAAGFALVLGNHMERAYLRSQTVIINSADVKSSVSSRPVFWIVDRYCRGEGGEFYGPGLISLGIDPGRLIRVLPDNLEAAIWAAGEISRDGKAGFGLLEIHGNPRLLDLAISRRLLLRCQKAGAPFFILRQAGEAQTSAVSTRWLVEPALSNYGANYGANYGSKYEAQNKIQDGEPHHFIGKAAWKISLEKCRGGRTGNWILEWNHHEQIFQIADPCNGKFCEQAPFDARQGGDARQRRKQGQKQSSPAHEAAPLSGGFATAIGNGSDHAEKIRNGMAAI